MRRRQKNHLRTVGVACAVSDAETQAAYIAPVVVAKAYKLPFYKCPKCGKIMKFLTNTHKRKCDAVIS